MPADRDLDGVSSAFHVPALLGRSPGPEPSELADGSLALSATTPSPGVVVIRAVGEIDLLTAPAWRRTMSAAARITASPSPSPSPPPPSAVAPIGSVVRRLVCDMSPTTFLGASGLGVLLDLHEQTGTDGVELRVVATEHSQPRRALTITGLDHRLLVHSLLEEAVTGAHGSTGSS